jgi:hypothetical protein
MSKFSYFWSKINPRTDSKTESCAEPHCAENCPEFTVLRVVQGPRMCPENTPRDLFLTRFDQSIKEILN